MTATALESKISPMMQQWHECKKQAKEALLLFRLGDFYEAFYEDAHILSKELELTLTKRQEIPMSGMPAHASDSYIDRLVSRGYKIAIAEQLEDPKAVKGIVKRAIVRMISPGTLVSSSLLKEKSNNYLLGISLVNKIFGLAVVDVSTGEFWTLECEDEKELLDEINRILPKELIVSEKAAKLYPDLIEEIKRSITTSISQLPDYVFDLSTCKELLCAHFHVHSLDGFGIGGDISSILASGALLSYVRDDLCINIAHIREIKKENHLQYMAIDRATQKHLELFSGLRSEENQSSLLYFMDRTQTSMGGRLLKKYLKYPLLSLPCIQERQDAVEELYRSSCLNELQKELSLVKDLERLIMRIETGYCSPKDLVALKDSLLQLPIILKLLAQTSANFIQKQISKFSKLEEIASFIQTALVDDPPLKLSDGGVFAKGYDSSLDELKQIQEEVQSFVLNYQIKLRESSNIKTLKVGYTKAFGFYIEISKAAAKEVPPTFFRRQTLVNAERFITEELKDFEYKLLHAEERIKVIESELFLTLRQKISAHAISIRETAQAIATLDVLASFAALAFKEKYTRPFLDESDVFDIEEGRHPIVEKTLGHETFIPNDLHLDENQNRMMVITGPNMAGKSTYMRQVALIAIMAQAGSFVPAKKVHLGVLDKVFSRIGASDDISRGQSTFMVEMSETANILNNATRKSLVILDEIGRGTSTYDGVSIAWAVAEYLLNHPKGSPKTLFATHYFELTALEHEIKGAVNYNVAVHESANGIVFLRKIVKGGTDKSYGIHVARLAGLPITVIQKAQSTLKKLEKQQKLSKPSKKEDTLELPLFSNEGSFLVLDPIKEELFQELKALNIDEITPLNALQKLFHWKLKLNGGN